MSYEVDLIYHLQIIYSLYTEKNNQANQQIFLIFMEIKVKENEIK